MVAISDATAKLPSLNDRNTNVNLAWKKIILDICLGHLNDALNAQQQTSKKLASKPSRASQLPSPDSIHLLDTDQLWQSLEFQNKALLPRVKERLRFLLRKKRLEEGPRSDPSHESSDKREHDNAKDQNVPLSNDKELSNHEESDSESSDDEEDETTPDRGQNPLLRDGKEDSASLGLANELSDSDPEIAQSKRKDEERGRLIRTLEDSIVAPKPWALRGEVSASARPKNSLLESSFEFDTSRKPDVISIGDLNASIEDLIKRRVADSQFDDIIPQDAPRLSRDDNLKPDNGEDDWLSEKPRKGLGEVYADEFKESGKSKEELSLHSDRPAGHHDKKYAEIYADFDRITQKLDALCGYSVTPLVSEVTGSAAEAVPEDIVKAEAMVSLKNDKEDNKRVRGDSGSTRQQRKRKRRKNNGSKMQV